MATIIRALVAITKVDPKRALLYVMAAIGVLNVALESLKQVAAVLAGIQ